MNNSINTVEEVAANPRELIAFAFVEEAYSRTGDLVAGVIPLFVPVLAKKSGRRFDPEEFAADVQKTYDIPMSALVASGLVEKLAEARLLYIDESESHTYRIATGDERVDSFDESGADALLAEFAVFANTSLEPIGLRQESSLLSVAFLQRLTSAQFLSFTDRREKNYYRGNTVTLKRIEDDERDAVQLEQALDVLSAEFALRKLEGGGAPANLLNRLLSGAMIAEVVLTLQSPSSLDALAKVTAAFDGPLILDYLDLSTPELRDYAIDLFDLVGKSAIRKVVFKHTLEEMKGTIRGPLEALQRGEEPFGPLGNRIRADSSHAAYARTTLADLEKRVEEQGFELIDADALSVGGRLKFCDVPTEESLRNNIGILMENLDRRIRDAHSIAAVLRARGDARNASTIADSQWILVTRNESLADKSRAFLIGRKVIGRDVVPPAVTDRRLAGYLWFAVGGSIGSLPRKKLIANCSNVVSPRTDVVSKVRQYLSELDPEKASLFVALMHDQRAQRCLVHSTLGFPGAVSLDNAEQLLAEMRSSVAAEVREEAERREAELKRVHEEQLANISRTHQEEVLTREEELLKLRNNFAEHKTLAEEEIARRENAIEHLGQRLKGVETMLESDVDARFMRAAGSAKRATRALKALLIIFYLILVGCAYWITSYVFTPDQHIYTLIVTLCIALIGFWIVPQVLYDNLAARLWIRILRSRCEELGVLEHLGKYEIDEINQRFERKKE